MRMSDHRPSGEGNNEVNMTPLIDVSLVLVVILLLATPLAFESSIAVRQAVASGRQATDESKKERIEIDILTDELVTINREQVPSAQLEAFLQPLLATSSQHQVIVTCADQVSHGGFVDVLDRTRQCGATNIAVKE